MNNNFPPVSLFNDDCLAVLRTLPDNSIDSIVTDPPYGLSRTPDMQEVLSHWMVGDDYQHRGGGFMGKSWDSFVPGPSVWKECLRVLKPGGYLLAFFGARTQDLGTIAIRLAGFDIRDSIAWMYASGFPKSMNMLRATEPLRGTDCYRELTGKEEQYKGMGSALKPAHEPITVARKPFKGPLGKNFLVNGTGALNIDACRVPFASEADELESKAKNQHASRGNSGRSGNVYHDMGQHVRDNYDAPGRWPANLIHDGSPEVLALFPDAGSSTARFFYCPKASQEERHEGVYADKGNHHPTVKPVALMEYLCRLVTPAGGLVLDPFMGSGTTGKAAIREGFHFIGIEQNESYFAIAQERISFEKPPVSAALLTEQANA